jgi:hypothetical protein
VILENQNNSMNIYKKKTVQLSEEFHDDLKYLKTLMLVIKKSHQKRIEYVILMLDFTSPSTQATNVDREVADLEGMQEESSQKQQRLKCEVHGKII